VSPEDSPPVRGIFPGIFLAALLFSLLFGTEVLPFDFWWGMALSNLLLAGYAILSDRTLYTRLKKDLSTALPSRILLGLLSAALLYLFFQGGDWLSRWIMPQSARGVDSIYGLKNQASFWRMALLIVFVIGPGEEFFWRGFLQHQLMQKISGLKAVVLSSLLYAAVHLAGSNFMLLLAALTCGLFWGALYLWKKSLTANMISHSAWDLAVFLLLPFR